MIEATDWRSVGRRLAYNRTFLSYSIPAVLLTGAGVAALYLWSPDGGVVKPEEVGRSNARAEAAALPAPPELKLLPVTPEEAVKINAAIPFAESAGPPAKPFIVRDAPQRATALDCLTSAIYYEAASESEDGQRAVAQVVLNRVRHPVYPASVCGVVFQGFERTTGCQFTFTCDGSLRRTPSLAGWSRARRIASAALTGSIFAPVGNATHYHANWVVPYWAKTLDKSIAIGAHIFYRWKGQWGTPSAFRQRYAGVENDPTVIIKAKLLAEPEPVPGEGTAETLVGEGDVGKLKADMTDSGLRVPEAKPTAEGIRLGLGQDPVADAKPKSRLLPDSLGGRLKDEYQRGSSRRPATKAEEASPSASAPCVRSDGAATPAGARVNGRVEPLDLRLKPC